MDIVPWRPFGEMNTLRREMDTLWNRFFRETPFTPTLTTEWLPTVDITETKDKLVIKAELPGLDAKDVDIGITNEILTIKGEKKEEEEVKGEHHYCVERYHGTFERQFRLPLDVKTDKVDAVFEKGILTINLPKTEKAKAKEIKIKVH